MTSSDDRGLYRHWSWFVGGLGVVSVVVLAVRFGTDIFRNSYWFAYLLLPAAWFHEFEEYAVGDFWGWYNNTCFKSKERFFPLTRKRAFFINLSTVPMVIIQALIAPQFIYLTLFLLLSVHANAWMHLIYTVGEGKYSPGTVTSVVFYWPLTYGALYQIVSQQMLPMWELVVVFIVSVFGGFGLFGYLRGVARREPDRLYPVPAVPR